MKNTLPSAISGKVDLLLKEARVRHQSGDVAGAIVSALSAWELLPEPRLDWDFYPQIMTRGLVGFYVEVNDQTNARKWIEVMANAYDDPNHEDHLVLMVEGEAYHHLGERERATYVFTRIFEIYGENGFEGDQKQFLALYVHEQAGTQR